MTTPTPRTATPAPRVHLSEAEVAELRAELDRARAELGRAQELIAELRDVGERADRAFARYDTGGGETPPDLGSATRARGVAVEGPESAVDGQTPATPTQPIGAPSIAPQHAERTSQ